MGRELPRFTAGRSMRQKEEGKEGAAVVYRDWNLRLGTWNFELGSVKNTHTAKLDFSSLFYGDVYTPARTIQTPHDRGCGKATVVSRGMGVHSNDTQHDTHIQ